MMQAKPQCDRCFLRQAHHAAELAGLDAAAAQQLVSAIRGELARLPPQLGAPAKASRIHALIRKLSGNPDPYRAAKRAATEQALQLYPRLEAMVSTSDDPLGTAVRLAIAGNIIDLGVGTRYDLEGSIERVLREPLEIDHTERLRQALAKARDVLYLADNAGESVLDRLLVDLIEAPVTYVVKGGPAVNDATHEDALAAGMQRLCRVVDHGAATLGTLLDQCSAEFRHAFAEADVVIAKGMANYESLEGSRSGLYFLLQTKCAVVSEHMGVPEHSLIVMEDGIGLSPG